MTIPEIGGTPHPGPPGDPPPPPPRTAQPLWVLLLPAFYLLEQPTVQTGGFWEPQLTRRSGEHMLPPPSHRWRGEA